MGESEKVKKNEKNVEETHESKGEISNDSPSTTQTELPKVEPETGNEIETIRAELQGKIEELQSLNEKFLRLAAEFENYKRRARRDQNETARFANEQLLKDLLPTLDSLERAIQCGQEQPTGDGLLQGVELTHKQFMDTLNKMGVSKISSAEQQFDPSKHQAIAQVESPTVPPNHVVEEFQTGYFLHDRILRPAMVTVAKAASDSTSQGENSQEQEGEKA